MSLCSLIPDVELLLSLPPGQVGMQLLKLVAKNLQNEEFTTGGVAGRDTLFDRGPWNQGPSYSQQNAKQIELAVAEAWLWLENSLLSA